MPSDLTFLHSACRPRCIASVDKQFTYHTLQFMSSGGIRLSYDHQQQDLVGRWLWACYPGPHIRFHNQPAGEPWHHRYIAFTGPRVSVWQAEGIWPLEHQQVDPSRAQELARLFDQLIACSKQSHSRSRLEAANLLERLLLQQTGHSRTAALPSAWAWLDQVKSKLADPRISELDYHQLAQQAGLSLTTLRRQFRQATGTSLHQYRLACRIAAARQLLGETDWTIKRIADQLGYQDVFYFSRQFRLWAGVSPAVYRRSRQV